MAGSFLFPAIPPLSLLFSSPSHLFHARREHRRQCPICKTVCAVKSVVPIYINRHTACHCGGKGETRMGGEDCRCRQCQDDPDPPRRCIGNGPKGATTVGCDTCAPPPMSTAATTAATVVAGHNACCCHHQRRQQRGDNATVTMATMGTTTETTACTVTAASTAAAATARAPCRNCHRCPCHRSYLCLHALSFCVSCFFYCSH
jgi:hypothetical protein